MKRKNRFSVSWIYLIILSIKMEVPTGIEPVYAVLQTAA